METCNSKLIHPDNIDKVRMNKLEESVIIRLSEFYKAFSDPTRIKILTALFYSELCVCELTEVLAMTQPAVSHQLKLLKTLKLVKYRKEGKVVYYSLDDRHIEEIFKSGLDHINEGESK